MLTQLESPELLFSDFIPQAEINIRSKECGKASI